MYHQFKQLADIDITQEPMEVGPTTHYMMGGIRVRRRHQMSTVPGLFAAGECAAGLHGANRLGGNSLSDLLVFGKRAGEYAARFAQEHRRRGSIADAGRRGRRAARSSRSSARDGAEGPYQVQHDAAGHDAGPRRHRARRQRRWSARSRASRRSRGAPSASASRGNREYNPGWHTALDLRTCSPCREAITRAALERKESRGAHFRDDYPDKDAALRQVQHRRRGKDAGRRAWHVATAIPSPAELPRRVSTRRSSRRLKCAWRDAASDVPHLARRLERAERSRDYTTDVSEGMVVLDAVHQIQAEQANDLAVRWNCKAGKCGSCSAEINGMPKLMCMTRLERPAARRSR